MIRRMEVYKWRELPRWTISAAAQGHYIMDLKTILNAYVTTISPIVSKYGKCQYEGAKGAYDFIIRMGFLSYEAAAEGSKQS